MAFFPKLIQIWFTLYNTDQVYTRATPTLSNGKIKIYEAAARRRTFKTKNIFIEDNNYE